MKSWIWWKNAWTCVDLKFKTHTQKNPTKLSTVCSFWLALERKRSRRSTVSHLRCWCGSAALPRLPAEACTSDRSVPHCFATAEPSSLKQTDRHHHQSPAETFSNRTNAPRSEHVCPLQARWTPATKCKAPKSWPPDGFETLDTEREATVPPLDSTCPPHLQKHPRKHPIDRGTGLVGTRHTRNLIGPHDSSSTELHILTLLQWPLVAGARIWWQRSRKCHVTFYWRLNSVIKSFVYHWRNYF